MAYAIIGRRARQGLNAGAARVWALVENVTMQYLKVGFIGLGNVGAKLAGSLSRHHVPLVVRDLNAELEAPFIKQGASRAPSPQAMAQRVDVIITCLPSPAASADVMERADGILAGLTAGKVWLEMSTTDSAEVKRLGALVAARGATALDCPVSGGCHRAATGNISIFAGGSRAAFEAVLPLLSLMGRRILHTGELGSASVLKVVTNYLCTVHLAALAEALTVCKVGRHGHEYRVRGDTHFLRQLLRS